MDYELIFWIVSCIGAWVGFGLYAKATHEPRVEWVAELGGKKW